MSALDFFLFIYFFQDEVYYCIKHTVDMLPVNKHFTCCILYKAFSFNPGTGNVNYI